MKLVEGSESEFQVVGLKRKAAERRTQVAKFLIDGTKETVNNVKMRSGAGVVRKENEVKRREKTGNSRLGKVRWKMRQ